MLLLLQHSLGTHIVTHLRDRTTKPATFRTLAYQISSLLAFEATRDLATREITIETPLEPHLSRVLSEPIVLVPILRAGISMVRPFTELLPDVSVGYVGLERDEQTAIARSYYCKFPPLGARRVLILDPMLATGGSAVQALQLVHAQGVALKDLSIVCIVCAPEGVRLVEALDPGIKIYAAALDRELNVRKYILPGLGDFGDRLYGT
ncbi:MAG: uracil phosphoribosyltransferase [Verrucomicrobia bacterium]|nr:uracil phosphoribosyltransferase [Verrucomicrobiota bacterium]MBV9643328.1 uracil phosphoribosyltransferase [Verrucomicrobiota bacterium]